MAIQEFFGSKTKRDERIILFLVLPVVAGLTFVSIYLLLHESKKVANEDVPANLGSALSAEAQPRLEPPVLLQKLQEAEGLENLGDFESAEAAFAAITRTNPESDRGWGGLGRTLLVGKKYNEACVALDQACRLNVVEARHFAARGAARRAMNDLKHAIRDYRDALSLAPGNTLTSNTLLFVALEMGGTSLYEQTLEKIRQASPGSEARWVFASAIFEMRAGNTKEAMELINKAPEILPKDQCQTLLSDRIFADKRAQDLIQNTSRNVSP